MHLHSRLALAALMSVAVMSGCGGDDEPSSVVTETTTATEPAATPTPMPTTATEPAAGPPPMPTATAGSEASRESTRQLSREQAISVARRRYPGGRVREVERDDEDGEAVWKVKIRTTPSVEREVSVAIDGGRIVKTKAEEIDRNEDDD